LDKRVDDGYQLPDGTQVYLGAQRFRLAEYYFRPETIPVRTTSVNILCTSSSYRPFFFRQNKYSGGAGQGRQGLSRMVHEAISSCDNDLRKELYRNIVLSGGSSLFATLNERLTQDLAELAPTQLKKDVKVVAAPPVERKFSVFIGGSILGSLGTFHQMWMSKGEYEEHGKALVDRKCP
jgi:actin-like protein 6A